MTIQMSDEQQQALAAGQPVEVIDSDSQLHVIVVAAERYRQRIKEIAEEEMGQPKPAAQETGPIFPPLPCHIRDLPTPPEIAECANRHCAKRYFWWRKTYQDSVEEDLKLQFYFGGIYVGYLRNTTGCVVVAAGHMESEEFGKQLDDLPARVRREVVLFLPPPWNEPDYHFLTPFPNED
jgi:hypothetical protein